MDSWPQLPQSTREVLLQQADLLFDQFVAHRQLDTARPELDPFRTPDLRYPFLQESTSQVNITSDLR